MYSRKSILFTLLLLSLYSTSPAIPNPPRRAPVRALGTATHCPKECLCGGKNKDVRCDITSETSYITCAPSWETLTVTLFVNSTPVSWFAYECHSVKKLVLSTSLDSPVTILQSDTFSGLRGLSTLDIGSGTIQSLPTGILKHLNNALTTFRMEKNHLSELRPDIFNPCPVNDLLSLTANKIRHIAGSPFLHCSRVVELQLGTNNISHLPKETFVGLSKLEKLILRKNQLTEMTERVLDPLSAHLTLLDLSGNQITALRANTFGKMDKLKTLLLVDNKITELDADVFQETLPHLVSLNLRNNLLVSLPSSVFSYLKFMERLDLSHNRLRHLPPELFVGLKMMKKVDLRGNLWLSGVSAKVMFALPATMAVPLVDSQFCLTEKETVFNSLQVKRHSVTELRSCDGPGPAVKPAAPERESTTTTHLLVTSTKPPKPVKKDKTQWQNDKANLVPSSLVEAPQQVHNKEKAWTGKESDHLSSTLKSSPERPGLLAALGILTCLVLLLCVACMVLFTKMRTYKKRYHSVVNSGDEVALKRTAQVSSDGVESVPMNTQPAIRRPFSSPESITV